MPRLHRSPLRAIRSPAPALAAALTIAWAIAGLVPKAHDVAGDPVARHQTDAGLPADTLSHRAPDLQGADRGRDRTPGPGGADGRPGLALSAAVVRAAQAAPAPPPEDAALRALERAGRNAAPSTAPPQLS
jgi:hypothetical protein